MSDLELWDRFTRSVLSHQEWNHRCHVRVAYLHLSRFDFSRSLQELRISIQKLNAAHGVVETPSRGYNETITAAFLRLVAHLMDSYPTEGDSETFCDENPQIMSPRILRLYYSKERLWEPSAKTEFLSPDLSTLPQIPLR